MYVCMYVFCTPTPNILALEQNYTTKAMAIQLTCFILFKRVKLIGVGTYMKVNSMVDVILYDTNFWDNNDFFNFYYVVLRMIYQQGWLN